MKQLLSACGLLCDKCHFFNKECSGCYSVKGSTFWAKAMMPNQICPLYKCSIVDKRCENCGQCLELPCKIYTELKDPNITDEEHKKSIQERVNRLKGI